MRSTRTLAAHGVGVAVGLLLAGWAVQAVLWRGYMRANPDVGSVSSSPGYGAVTVALFLIGATLAYTAFARGIGVAVRD